MTDYATTPTHHYDNGSSGNNNSVAATETIGTAFLGIITILLLFALLRSQRYARRILEKQIESQAKGA